MCEVDLLFFPLHFEYQNRKHLWVLSTVFCTHKKRKMRDGEQRKGKSIVGWETICYFKAKHISNFFEMIITKSSHLFILYLSLKITTTLIIHGWSHKDERREDTFCYSKSKTRKDKEWKCEVNITLEDKLPSSFSSSLRKKHGML